MTYVIRHKNAVKVLGQKLKRKDIQLQKVKEKSGLSNLEKELTDVKKALFLPKKRHKQMKHDQKLARKKWQMKLKKVKATTPQKID